jgi:hypothetical protein
MSVLLVLAAHVGGCASIGYDSKTAVRTGTVRSSTLKLIEAHNMERTAPVLTGRRRSNCRLFHLESTQNLASHADDPNMPFWKMLKAGIDVFFATEQPPKVAVCDRRYVFNVSFARDLDPSAPCPVGVDSTAIAEAQQPVQASYARIPANTGVDYRADDAIHRTLEKI